MSEAYSKVKGGRLTYKGGALATRAKDIEKKKKKKKKTKNNLPSFENDDVSVSIDPDNIDVIEQVSGTAAAAGGGGSGGGNEGGEEETYTIDPMKKMKYDELFPVETKKFGYDARAKAKSVEDALNDRVKKKADRYCK